MPSVAVLIPCEPSNHELLIGLLMTDHVQGAEERDHGLVLFYDPSMLDEIKGELEQIAAPFKTDTISYELIQDRNWNADWEKTIKPIYVPPFWIRPSWDASPLPEGCIELIIDPKMSFGTGYHESTRLMMGALTDMVQAQDSVLDAGTGTGVLAFAALKIGARSAFSFDIDPICKENAEENAELNQLTDQFVVVVGTESVILEKPDDRDSPILHQYDVVMANINREALRAMLPVLARCMKSGGRMGLAGLLVSDRDIMLKALDSLSLTSIREATEGDWWSVWVKKKTT